MPFLLDGLFDDWRTPVAAVLVVAVAYLVVRLLGRRFRRPSRSSALAARGIDTELESTLADLHDFSREIEGRLDTRIAALRKVIDEAERVEGRLEALLGRAGRQAGPQGEGGPGGTAGDADDPPAAAVDETFPTFRRVVELFEAGRPVNEIAGETGLPAGEVELMLNLHRTQRAETETR